MYEDLKVGDVVQSVQIPTVIGRVVEVTGYGTGVVIVDGRRLVTVMKYWKKIRR